MAYELLDEAPKARYEILDPVAAQPMSRMEKIRKGLSDPFDGGAQLLTKFLPSSVVNAGNAANNWIADKTGLVARLPEGGVDQQVRDSETAYQAKRTAAGESGFDGYRTIGNVASPANLALAAKLPQAASLAGRIGVGALGGAGSSMLNPVSSGDYWGEKSQQVATGAAFGGATPMLTGAVGRMISPNASKNTNLQLLKSEGVKPTIGQTLGGFANTMEEKAQSLPLVGDAITAARQRAKEQFNNAAINRSSGRVGVKVDGSGQDAIAEAGNVISNAYDKGKQALGNFAIDRQGAQEMQTLKQMSAQLQPKERNIFNKLHDTYQRELTPNGHLLPDAFKRLDSKLGADQARFSGSPDAYQKELGDAIKEMQRVITDNAKRANPAAAKAINDADRAWANLVRVEGASNSAKGTGGIFTPGQLLSAVKGADKSVRDRATARGTALMQDLGNAGQSVLGNKVPDSGTAGRLMLGGGALGSYLINPAIPAGLLAGAAAYSSPIQGLLRGAVSSRGKYAEPVAQALQKAAPVLLPGSAQLGLGLLNY